MHVTIICRKNSTVSLSINKQECYLERPAPCFPRSCYMICDLRYFRYSRRYAWLEQFSPNADMSLVSSLSPYTLHLIGEQYNRNAGDGVIIYAIRCSYHRKILPNAKNSKQFAKIRSTGPGKNSSAFDIPKVSLLNAKLNNKRSSIGEK